MDKIRIGENEYQPPFDADKMNEYEEVVFDEIGDIVSIDEIVSALNDYAVTKEQLAQLRQANKVLEEQRDTLQKRVEELERELDEAHKEIAHLESVVDGG